MPEKTTYEKLEKNEKLLKLYMEFTPAATAMCDLEMRYLAYSNRWVTDYNLPEENLLGRSHYDVFESIPDEWKQQHKRCFEGEVIINKEETFTRADGSIDWVCRTLHPWFGEDDEVGGLIMFTEVITEKKKAEHAKERLQASLLQSQKMESIGVLAGGIAHDFNNILAAILGYTELEIEDAEPGTERAENLQEIFSAGKRASDLVRQILTFARQTNEEIKPVQMSEIIKKSTHLLRPTTPSVIELVEQLNSDSFILANESLVQQVIMNIATNAMHAMEEDGGTLSIQLEDVTVEQTYASEHDLLNTGDYVKITISDTGKGIAAEDLGYIFEPYYTTKEVGKGTGMGLSQVHGTVQKYSGTIMVKSRLGFGSTFTILLPVIKSGPKTTAQRHAELPHGTEKILFVDDELTIAKMNKRLLGKLGYAVTTRTCSVDALELFQDNPNEFDLIITDMTMPNLTGDKFAVELIKIRRDIPVILCTGYSNRISEEAALKIGIKAFAYKPLVNKDLAETVRKVLDEVKE